MPRKPVVALGRTQRYSRLQDVVTELLTQNAALIARCGLAETKAETAMEKISALERRVSAIERIKRIRVAR
jgi:hypothetical protein